MRLFHVFDVEPIMVSRNRARVEEVLEVCVSIERIEKFIKRNRDESRMSAEAVAEDADVGIARFDRRKGIILKAYLELSSLFNMRRPIFDVVVLRNNLNNRNNPRSNRIFNLFLQSQNLNKNVS